MSNDSAFRFLLVQFIHQAPTLLVCGIGLMAALVQWQRFPRAAMLAAGGLVLWPLTSLVAAVLIQFLIASRSEAISVSRFSSITAVNIASSALHAIALAMIVSAIFANRSASFSSDHFPSKPFA